MAFDGVLLFGLARELENTLLGGRVIKIQQPEKDEIHIQIRNKGNNHRLVLSASPSHPRIHLTMEKKTNPPSAPMFCMVLRKHLSGGKLVTVRQPNNERILELDFEIIDEIGDLAEKTLVIEIMGRHSNIILTGQDGMILDAIKHVDQRISRVRQVLPNRQYVYPPSQGKVNPLTAAAEDVAHILQPMETGIDPAGILSNSFTGVSKATAEEICHRAQTPKKQKEIAASFVSFFQQVQSNKFQPVILRDDKGKPRDIFPMIYSIYHPDLLDSFSTFSEALDSFFILRDKVERIQQRTSHLNRIVKTNLERCYKKLALQEEELEKAKNAEEYRLFGELITSNIYQIPSGADKVVLPNYYETDYPMITIPLDPSMTPAQNAQNYFKNYSKAVTVTNKQSQFMKENLEEVNYLESILQNLSMCTDESDVSEIREELIQQGYIRERSERTKAKSRQKTSKPHHFISSDGLDIMVGKNNIQNDKLTLKAASPNDLWLHTKSIQGSHVIIKTGDKPVPETTLLEAANLAAWYSKGRFSSNVPVDYCPRKNVRKPGGAKPGMVVYDRYKTIYVTPSESMVRSLKKLM